MRFVLSLFTLVWAAACASAQPVGPGLTNLLLEPPECVNSQNGRLDCLVRDTKGQFVWTFHDGQKWSRPRILLGQFAGPASCVVRGPLGLNCFAVRGDGTLWHIAMNGGAWRQWRPLGGRLALGRPSCVAPSRNQIACYARSRQGTLAVKAWLGDETWQEWRDAGGALAGDPSCVRLSLERVACFWRRTDGSFSGLIPGGAGPGTAVLTLPRQTGQPSCAPLDGDRALCLSQTIGSQTFEWRGAAVLGGAGVDGVRLRPDWATSRPLCATRSGRTFCTFLSKSGELVTAEATLQGWSPAIVVAPVGAATGRCAVFDQARAACSVIFRDGSLRAVFRELTGAGVPLASAAPTIVEKPPVPTAAAVAVAPPALAAAPVAPVSTVSVREPLGAWRVFEPRSGLHCQITLFDAPAQPYRSLTRDADCNALESLRGVARWSQAQDAIVLRDARGRVFFRFTEAGPTALRARWRRSDFVMLARDLRAFAAGPSPGAPPSPTASPPTSAPPATTAAPTPGIAGVWRLRGPGRRTCLVRLSLDADTALTSARPDGCQGMLAQIDGWSVRRGALVLERDGAPIARFIEGRGVIWRGRFEGGRRGLSMVKQ